MEYAKHTYTRDGSPLKVFAPPETGPAEIRYHSGQGVKVMARIPITVTAATDEE